MSASNIRKIVLVSLITGATIVSGCSPIIQNHGYLPIEAEAQSLAQGQATKQSVLELYGEPTSKGAQGDSSWYYVSYKVKHFAFFKPKVTERRILAVSFDANGRVASVNRYGLENGRIVDLNTRETVTGGRKLTILQQLIRNVGNFSAESFL